MAQMTVLTFKQIDYGADLSQMLLEASNYSGDLEDSTDDLVTNPSLDVNYVGSVKSNGADVNYKLFRGYVTTAAVREGHLEILEILLKVGASQPACEEALLEASYHGRASVVDPLMCSEFIRPHIAVHALVTACCRGFTEVADALIKCGVDPNVTDRVLLQSCKPSLHANFNCNALVAAIVSRQVSVVRLLLQVGSQSDIMVRLGTWSWDTATGEEFRIGAGLADPYLITWCAVEYFEKTGTILKMLLKVLSKHPTSRTNPPSSRYIM